MWGLGTRDRGDGFVDVFMEAMEMACACFYWDLRVVPNRLLKTFA